MKSSSFFGFLFPWYKSTSVEDIIMKLAMYPRFESRKSCLIFGWCILWTSIVTVKGFLLLVYRNKYLSDLFCYKRQALEPIGHLSFLAISFAMIEICCTRIYVAYTFHSSKDHRPGFMHLLSLNTPQETELVVSLIKTGNFVIIVIPCILFQTLNYVSASDTKSFLGLCFVPVWILMAFLGPTFAGPEVNTLANVANACFGTIMRHSRDLIGTINSLTEKQSHQSLMNEMADILLKYRKVVDMVGMYSQLSMIFMLLFEILVIPIYSVVGYEFFIPVGSIQLLIKIISIVAGSVYCLRGYVLAALLAGMDSQSKKLHSALMSLVIHKPIHTVNKIKILYILEDLSCTRNHWAISEYGGHKVTRMDLVYSIFGTLQLIMLGSDFQWLLRETRESFDWSIHCNWTGHWSRRQRNCWTFRCLV